MINNTVLVFVSVKFLHHNRCEINVECFYSKCAVRARFVYIIIFLNKIYIIILCNVFRWVNSEISHERFDS